MDLQEEEVWATMNAREISSISKTGKKISLGSSSSSARRLAVARPVPKSTSGGGGALRASAPVDIPDWSMIMKKKSYKKLMDDGAVSDDGDDMVAPHEYLARRVAGTNIASSFSMCEGVGGTLKGRYVTNFRNAILTKTGFLEQNK